LTITSIDIKRNENLTWHIGKNSTWKKWWYRKKHSKDNMNALPNDNKKKLPKEENTQLKNVIPKTTLLALRPKTKDTKQDPQTFKALTLQERPVEKTPLSQRPLGNYQIKDPPKMSHRKCIQKHKNIHKKHKNEDHKIKARLAKRDIFERAYWKWRGEDKLQKNKFKHKYKHFKQRLSHESKRIHIEEHFAKIQEARGKACWPTPSQVDWVNRTSSWHGDKAGHPSNLQSPHTPTLCKKHKKSEEGKQRRRETRAKNKQMQRAGYRDLKKDILQLATESAPYLTAQDTTICGSHLKLPYFKRDMFLPDRGGGIEQFLYKEEIQEFKTFAEQCKAGDQKSPFFSPPPLSHPHFLSPPHSHLLSPRKSVSKVCLTTTNRGQCKQGQQISQKDH